MSYRNNNNPAPRRSSNDGNFGGYRVYVGDIGQRIGKSDLEREFTQYGPVTDVWMGKKREPSAPDYAFIVFKYPDDAEEAVRDRNGRKLCGRTVRVEHARPIGSNPRRGARGGGGGWGGGNRDYNNYQNYQRGGGGGGGNNSRRRSLSRERSGKGRSRSQSPVRNNRAQQSPIDTRRRTETSLPRKASRRSPSDSPDSRPVKSKKSKRQSSSSASPPPQPRSKQQEPDSDSGNSSPSPPPKKKPQPRSWSPSPKKKQPRSWSPSQSPGAIDEYDARQYQKVQDEPGAGKKGKSSHSKTKNYEQHDNYSSDGY